MAAAGVARGGGVATTVAEEGMGGEALGVAALGQSDESEEGVEDVEGEERMEAAQVAGVLQVAGEHPLTQFWRTRGGRGQKW